MRSHWLPSVMAVAGVILAGGGLPGASTPVVPPSEAASDWTTSVPSTPAVQEVRDTFPHLDHEGLFPFCTGCHEGIPEGDEATMYPETSFCAGCHDGVEAAEVDWIPPVPDAEPDNLEFSHPVHIAGVAAEGDEPLTCGSCHAPPAASRMTVEPLEAERCLSCHAHPGEQHVVDADCSTCHVPLARSDLPPERIAGMPAPPSHDQPEFVLELHGQEALDGTVSCTTCHTRDLCASCHVGGAADAIERLDPAPPAMTLPEYRPVYPVPPSHADPDFQNEHGDEVRETENSRVTCHTRDDCTSCHLAPLPAGTTDLPTRESVRAPGVGLAVDAPATHADPYFQENHGVLAAADDDSCASCHTEPFCASCHEAPARPEFHPSNYLARHSADAWGSTTECSSCHQVQASCRACHVQSGLTQTGRLGAGYHDAEPMWLLRHPQAARQSLESCASCHTQKECLQCHSETGAFQVSPHGPDFDAARARERNPVICRTCHLGDPLGGGGGP